MKFKRIQREKANFPVAVMCDSLGVSRSGYYAFETRGPSKRAIEDAVIGARIAESFRQSRGAYGSPRILQDLQEEGHRVSRKRVVRIMKERALCARQKRRFKTTTVVDQAHPKQSNILARQFSQATPNRAWVSDLTAVWTLQGWLYVVGILDLFSRRIVGWGSSATPDAAMCIRAFEAALDRRRPPSGLIFHSDRGCQYTSVAFQASVRRAGGVSSMSRKGNCWDNAPMESFWGSMKREFGDTVPATRAEAHHRVFDYIEAFYNPRRRHSTLGYLSPIQFEQAVTLSRVA